MKTWMGTVGLFVLLTGQAVAGEIVLRNGSRLSGELSGDAMLVSTGSGVVEIEPGAVTALTPEEVRLKDGRVIHGTLVGQYLKTRTTVGELAIKLDEVASFRAAPEPAPRPAAPVAAEPPAGPGASPAPASAETPGAPVPAPAPVASSPAASPSAGGPQEVTEGAKQIGRGVSEAAKGVGRTVVEGADIAHDGFKAFGLKIRDAVQGVKQTWQNIFGS